MKVYLLVKESYIYWDNEYATSIKAFIDKQSAINYLELEKERLLEDAMEQLDVKSVEEIQRIHETEEYVYSYENRDDFYYIDIEEWGYDCLNIEEHDIMEFNI